MTMYEIALVAIRAEEAHAEIVAVDQFERHVSI